MEYLYSTTYNMRNTIVNSISIVVLHVPKKMHMEGNARFVHCNSLNYEVGVSDVNSLTISSKGTPLQANIILEWKIWKKNIYFFQIFSMVTDSMEKSQNIIVSHFAWLCSQKKIFFSFSHHQKDQNHICKLTISLEKPNKKKKQIERKTPIRKVEVPNTIHLSNFTYFDVESIHETIFYMVATENHEFLTPKGSRHFLA